MEVSIKEKDRILVVAPHADDESIGCGGLLSLYGKQCDLLLLTDGSKGHTTEEYSDEAKLTQIRFQEFCSAANLAGVQHVFSLNIPDGCVRMYKQTVYAFDLSEYQYVFVPNRYESHLDHRVAFPIFRKMKKRQRSKARIFEYEVWTPLRHATWFLDISAVAENKRTMIEQHISQLADINYTEKAMALSCYRGMFNGTDYSEAFLYSDFSGIKSLIYTLLPPGMKNAVKNFISR